ncbi:MAG TPA: NAD(P)/FAD-dependent oxidoreductase [Pyrinomonadaceae bacterium]|nr:NAD(P)/FAD-dependent oxidoreductase [Pyrinomonadaceae bacterium]
MHNYDVTIIGAGLAGLQCARLLSRQGITVLLVDRKNALDQKIHTTGIFVRRTLVDFDIPEDCLGPPIRHVTLHSPALRPLELVSRHDEFRVGRMGQLYERYLQQCLHAGVHWLSNTTYLGASTCNGKLTVQLGNGSGSSTRSITTRYLIGGDGARSRVARDLELDLNREWIVGIESVYEGAVLDGPPRLLCFLDPQLSPGYIAWIAHDGEETHLGVGGYAARFDPLSSLAAFRDRVTHLIDLRQAKQIERRAGYIPVGGVLRNIANTNGLLIGDAAGAVSPLTAGGLDPCMRLSAFAAKVVAEYLSTGDPQTLNAYSGNIFRSRFASRLWARRIASTIRRPELLELGCAVLRVPLLNRLAHHVFFGRGSFPDVEMTDAFCGSPHCAVAASGPEFSAKTKA